MLSNLFCTKESVNHPIPNLVYALKQLGQLAYAPFVATDCSLIEGLQNQSVNSFEEYGKIDLAY